MSKNDCDSSRPALPSLTASCTQQSACFAQPVSRRRLLSLAGSSTGLIVVGVGTAALGGCGAATGSPPTGPVAAGNVASLTVGSMHTMSNIVVARDAGGVYAMSAICTHAGALLDDSSSTIAAGLSCPLHGSTFDGDGKVTGGPARSALQHYAVTLAADGSLTVEGEQPVTESTRTPVA